MVNTKKTRLLSRRRTSLQWSTLNEVLMDGEIGVVTDVNPRTFKIGDGVTAWNNLEFSGMSPSAIASIIAAIKGDVPDDGNTLSKLYKLAKPKSGVLSGAAATAPTLNLDFKEYYNLYLERDTGFTVSLTKENFGTNGVKYLVVKNINANTAIAISVVFNNTLVNIRGTALRIYAQSFGEISFKLEQAAGDSSFITVMFNSQEIDVNATIVE